MTCRLLLLVACLVESKGRSHVVLRGDHLGDVVD